MKIKCKINKMKSVDLTEDDDKHKPYFTGVAWIAENEFVAVDAGNAKIKIYSVLSGNILKKLKLLNHWQFLFGMKVLRVYRKITN